MKKGLRLKRKEEEKWGGVGSEGKPLSLGLLPARSTLFLRAVQDAEPSELGCQGQDWSTNAASWLRD